MHPSQRPEKFHESRFSCSLLGAARQMTGRSGPFSNCKDADQQLQILVKGINGSPAVICLPSFWGVPNYTLVVFRNEQTEKPALYETSTQNTKHAPGPPTPSGRVKNLPHMVKFQEWVE